MDPQALVAQQKAEFNSLLDRQKAEQQGLFNTYTQKVSAQPRLTDIFGQQQEKAGIGNLRNTLNTFYGETSNVKSLLDRLNENTQQRTTGTNTNQAYLDRIRAVEGGGLNTQLSRLGAGLEPVVSAYNTATDQLGQYMQLEQAQQANELKPYEVQINAMGDRFSREITGFTKNKEDELNVLMDKIQRERELSDREWQRAQQLASEEREYQRQRSYIAAQSASQGMQQSDPLKTKAQADVGNLLTKDAGRIQREYDAIRKSAGYGNTYDQMKLQLLDAYNPNLRNGVYRGANVRVGAF